MGTITSTLTSTLLFLITLALAESPAGTPRINSISYSGSGCPHTQAWFSGSLDNPTLTFNHFAIEYPNTVNRTANCQVHVQAQGVSAGWQVSVKDTFVDGHVTLDPGATLDYFSTVYFSSGADDSVSLFLICVVHVVVRECEQVIRKETRLIDGTGETQKNRPLARDNSPTTARLESTRQ